MNKTKRFIIVLVVLAVAFAFLLPSIQWYALTPKEDQALALGSREQIREFAWRMARTDLAEIERLVASSDAGPLPERFAPVVSRAKKIYKAVGITAPETWNAKAFLAAFDNRNDALAELEDYHRARVLSLKKLHGSAVQLGLDLSGGMSVVIRADLEALEAKTGKPLSPAERDDAVVRAVEVLNNRIDKFGLTEPVIRRQGEDRIYVEIPGAADPERINGIIMGRGRLAFHIVDEEATASLTAYLETNPLAINDDMKLSDPSLIPADTIVRKYYTKDKYGLDEWTGSYMVIKAEAGLDGNHIESATVSSDPVTGQPEVVFSLDKEGGELFYALTSANVDKTMAVVLDDRVRTGARISGPIQANVKITGFAADEANNLALILRSAALPVELIVESQQAIGASLGEDSILEGRNAILIGLIAVFVFMLVYYKGAGVNAAIAQVLNLYLMFSILSAFNLTLTLPSIAGFVLTIGMAVDANVIIFERIKEELREGKGRKAALEAGFNKAFWAVMDGNITTIIAALFLSQLGTGSIQGFAVSLAIGNMSSLFTALFVSRLLFDFNTDVFKHKAVSISWRVK
ncbi:MAG: protein translocase subunit SecD [Spirochaetae bacterium HGW-Spirochaetae-3]|jgi:preprotein translocase subunit SecD|nr:MAG: protein translocase subunit SecD [Spirochaetae bacterium HGW-Spirochaetae-3]